MLHNQQNNQQPIHILFNIENVLATHFYEKNVNKILKERPELQPLYNQNLFIQTIYPYLIYPGVIELMQWLFQLPNIKVSFFNSEDRQKSHAFVQALLSRALGDKYYLIQDKVAIYSNDDMIPSTKDERTNLQKIFDIRYGNRPGLFHGALAHMLQAFILIYALENGNIPFDFIIDNKVKLFTVKEILAAFVMMKTKNNESVWLFTR